MTEGHFPGSIAPVHSSPTLQLKPKMVAGWMRPSWNLHGGCPAFLGISWWCRKWSPGGTVGKETLEVWHPMAGDRTIHDANVKRGCIWTRVIHPIPLCLSHHNCTHKVPRVPLVRMQLVFIHTRRRSIVWPTVWPQKFRNFCCGVRFAVYIAKDSLVLITSQHKSHEWWRSFSRVGWCGLVLRPAGLDHQPMSW